MTRLTPGTTGTGLHPASSGVSTVTELHQVAAILPRAMANEPSLGLAMATAWLNPMGIQSFGDAFLYAPDDETDEAIVGFALGIARHLSPRLHAQLLKGICSGWSFREFADRFMAAFKERYPLIPLHNLEALDYGVPVEFYGMGWTDAESEGPPEMFLELIRAYFGPGPSSGYDAREMTMDQDLLDEMEDDDDGDSYYDASDGTLADLHHPLLAPIVRSLVREDRQPYADIALLLLYLFSETGNSSLDMSEEEFCEAGFDRAPWDTDSLEMMQDIHQEVAIHLAAHKRAMLTLMDDPEISTALRENIAAIRVARERNEDVKITWPKRDKPRCAAKSFKRGTGPDAALLFVRACYVEKD